MTIIGIDPGTATVGYAVVRGTKRQPDIIDYGVITTNSKSAMDHRLLEIGTDLEQLLTTHKPDLAVVEQLFYFKNQKTVITVAQARGVILYLACKHGSELVELTPLQIKQSFTGYGRANKIQIQNVVKKIYGLDKLPKPDDAADALAMAWCALP